jgi:hypothetical protein
VRERDRCKQNSLKLVIGRTKDERQTETVRQRQKNKKIVRKKRTGRHVVE